ncbi:sensory protein TspO [Meridianimarinicoccus roseus]|uniref:Sensory protein TspO n=1 Tax=Meridianimarinicoccus roseus TaxID=2072018 RepID=A0A2V2LGD5_9RHOB|nr:TspO/MBR family protein [Meridianimarinicoccus roseus]PWR02981.1 sensory protein TspO [Meridianimarinicoccus roseus]
MVYVLFFVFLAACVAAGSTGGLFPPGKWYEALNKPRWTPPDWVFPVAWGVLYLCIAAAAARVAMLPGAGLAMAFWALQVALNGLWTPVFFGLKRIRLGLVVVCTLWAVVAATMVLLYIQDPFAGLLFVPYLLWVTIASALNFAVMRLNPREAAGPAAA